MVQRSRPCAVDGCRKRCLQAIRLVHKPRPPTFLPFFPAGKAILKANLCPAHAMVLFQAFDDVPTIGLRRNRWLLAAWEESRGAAAWTAADAPNWSKAAWWV